MTTKVPDALLTKIRSGNRFLLTSHIHPDGDAVGSAVGLARLLHRQGKGAVVWLRDEPPRIYGPMPGSDRIHLGAEPPAGWPEMFDTAVTLECPSLDRTGLESHLGELPVLNIDHHLGNQLYGKVNWVDSAAPAVGEMIYRLAQALKIELDGETASCLYLTLVTDTGGFRFPNATAEAFDAAAALVREGARPEQVALWLYESQPEAVLRLLGEMLDTLELHHDGRIATVRLEPEMFERSGAVLGDAEGMIDYPRSIAGVEAVALLRRQPDGIKVSLRSRGDVDVERIAREYGGGGHHNAAGFTTQEEDDLHRRMVEELVRALDTEPGGDAGPAVESPAAAPAG
jgi:phosphoesterase RecJ-like protein